MKIAFQCDFYENSNFSVSMAEPIRLFSIDDENIFYNQILLSQLVQLVNKH